MKLETFFFLSKANLKGNQHSTSATVIIAILCISLSVLSVLSYTLSEQINDYKYDFRSKTIEAYPYNRVFDKNTLRDIKNISHVESVDVEDELRVQFFHIDNIYDDNGIYNKVQKSIDEKDTLLSMWSLIGNEKREVIAGKNLNETPEFSCIIPHLFYPFDEDIYETSGLNYINGETLIGKTLVLNEGSEGFNVDFFDGNEPRRVNIPSFEVKLNIVGVYYASVTADGDPSLIYVSENTGKKLLEMAVKKAKNDTDDLKKFMNKPEFHNIHITVDDFDNLSYVYNELTNINVSVVEGTELGINQSTPVIATVFNVLSYTITIFTFIISLIIILQSSKNVIEDKKSEIGMMKSFGYKNKQILGCLTFEQLIISFRGFLVGTAVSALIIAVINLLNYHGSYANRIYIVAWSDYLIFTVIAFAVVMFIPMLCQIITLVKLEKIQPKDAMNE